MPVTAAMGVRWNRRHGLTQKPAEAANEDRNWWMLPERRYAANRLLRRGEVAHDPETAYDVCTLARVRMVQLRNPWFYFTWATFAVGLQLLNIGAQLSFRASGQASLFWGIAFVTGCAALLAVVFLVRSRQLKAARSAFERNRLVAGDDKEVPLPDDA